MYNLGVAIVPVNSFHHFPEPRLPHDPLHLHRLAGLLLLRYVHIAGLPELVAPRSVKHPVRVRAVFT